MACRQFYLSKSGWSRITGGGELPYALSASPGEKSWMEFIAVVEFFGANYIMRAMKFEEEYK